jgi:hypothetical protein
MWDSGKKIRALRDKKKKYSNSRVVRKKTLNETKNLNPPPPSFKLNGRSLRASVPTDNSFVYGVFVVHLISYKDFASICSTKKHWLKMDYNTDNWEDILQALLRN